MMTNLLSTIARVGPLALCVGVAAVAVPRTAQAQIATPVIDAPIDGVAADSVAADSVQAFLADSLDVPSILHMTTLPATSRIVLRWSPSDAGGWLAARRFGYRIERAEYVEGIDPQSASYQPLTPQPLRPWPLDRYTEEQVQANNLLGVVGQAVHGEYFDAGMSTGTLRGVLRAAKETQHRFVYSQLAADLDSTAAEALAVRFVDSDVNDGDSYFYRLTVAGIDSVVAVDTAYVFATAYDPGPIMEPTGFAAEPGDSLVVLSWDKDPVRRFSGYWIERSVDGGRNYERITDGPFFGNVGVTDSRITFRDRNVTNYRVYRYRLRGITHFGVLSEATTTNVVPVDFEAPPPPFITATEHIEGSTVRIKWDVIAEGMPDDFAGFYVGHSIEHGGDYALDMDNLLSPDTREAIDSRAIATKANYYIVVAVDTAQNVAASLPMLAQLSDSIPPAPPVNFEVVAIEDSTGRIEIGWDAPEAADLYAYRVYRKHNLNDEWVLRNEDLHYASTFVDTLNLRSLTNEVYYQVVAIDYSFNPSQPSEPFRVPLPDFIPPVAPVFTEAMPTDSSVSMAWSRSPSFDVVEQILYRRLSTETDWTELTRFEPDVDSFVDYDVQKLRTYEYTMQVADSSGFLSNLAVPVKGRVYDTGVRPGIVSLTAVADTSEGFVRLEWSYPNPEEGEYWFVVYRGMDDTEPARYRSTGTESSFADRRVRFRNENAYSYAVQVMYRNGGMSPLSETVNVAYPRREE